MAKTTFLLITRGIKGKEQGNIVLFGLTVYGLSGTIIDYAKKSPEEEIGTFYFLD